jgi:hypothetical protein
MKKICKYCSKEIKGKAKNYDYYYFCNNIDCLDKYLNEPEKKDTCEYWQGSEKCTDKKADGSIFCRFHSDNLPF